MSELLIIKELPDGPLTTSIFVPFTRGWVVDEFLQRFEQIDFGFKSSVELVFFNDTNSDVLRDKLLAWLTKHSPNFAGAKYYQTFEELLPEQGDGHAIFMRRERIVAMKKKSAELIGNSIFVFSLEDDTFVAPDAYQKLLKHMGKSTVGLVSAIEVGRHVFPIIGAWKIEPLENPQTVQTVPFRPEGVQKVDATGWYCYITKTNLYKRADYRFEAECLGPDLCYGWDLTRAGREVLIDWSILCEHKQQNGQVLLPSEQSNVVTFTKDGDGWQNQLQKALRT